MTPSVSCPSNFSIPRQGPAILLHGMLDLERIGVMGVSLGAIVAAQACKNYEQVNRCLMLDAALPLHVAAAGLQRPALWISRPADDQRAERAASGGWPEAEITAQADSIARSIANSRNAQVKELRGLFHIDFTNLPAIQPLFRWIGLSGPKDTAQAQREINALTLAFFRPCRGRPCSFVPLGLRRA